MPGMQPASLLTLLPILIALVAAHPGPRIAQETSLSNPAKFFQLFTTAEKLGNDVGDNIEEDEEEEEKFDDEEGKQLMLIGKAGKRSYGVNIPGDAIMRALRSSSNGMPRSIRLPVQQHAMLRYLLHLICKIELRENYTLILLGP